MLNARYACIIFINILMFTHFTFADSRGRMVGNGGDVVICDDSATAPFKIDLLDHYESRVIHNLNIQLGPPSLDVMSKVSIAIERIRRLSPDRAKKYQIWANEFWQEVQFLDNIELIDIPDSQHVILPKNCRIQQIANQATIFLPGQKRYTIDNELWTQLNSDQKAGLLLHEIVYREALAIGHTDSIASRRLASIMASPLMERLSVEDLVRLLSLLRFDQVQIQGVMIDIRAQTDSTTPDPDVEFYPNGMLKSGKVVPNSTVHIVNLSNNFRIRGEISFYENGCVRELQLATVSAVMLKDYGVLQFSPQTLRFYESGALELGVLEQPARVQVPNFDLNLVGHFQLHENGMLAHVQIDKGIWHSRAGERIVTNQLKFYPSGEPEYMASVAALNWDVGQESLEIKGPLHFYDRLRLKSFWLGESAHSFIIQGRKIKVSGYNSVDLYENGHLKKVALAASAKLQRSDMKIEYFESGAIVQFNEQGLVHNLVQ